MAVSNNNLGDNIHLQWEVMRVSERSPGKTEQEVGIVQIPSTIFFKKYLSRKKYLEIAVMGKC